MSGRPTEEVRLRPWADGDLWLLERTLRDPEMTAHLGGPESLAKIRERHGRYLAMGDRDAGTMLVIVLGPKATPAGTHGYWKRDANGEIVWETGWFVLPEFQGRGIATRATQLMAQLAWTDAPERPIHAYPAVDNGASNAICRKAGFRLIGAFEYEYPPGQGRMLRCYDWVLDSPG